jgi:hypothetical protein
MTSACPKLNPKREREISEHLQGSDYCVTSEETEDYNCASHAMNVTKCALWPGYPEFYKWPVEGASDTVESFRELFRLLGFEDCGNDSSPESGWQKIALYSRQGLPTHLARQLANGRWSSKLGDYEDIDHITLEALRGREPETLDALTARDYGQVHSIFKKACDLENDHKPLFGSHLLEKIRADCDVET